MAKSFAECLADVQALTAVTPGTSWQTRRAYNGNTTVHMTQTLGYRVSKTGEKSVHTYDQYKAASCLERKTTML